MIHFRDFFYFQKSDRQVLVVALVVAVVAFALIYFVGGKNDHTDAVAPDSLLNDDAKGGRNAADEYYATEKKDAELFAFDPNTADSTQLLRLGLLPWQVKNIYKYRANGGVYRKPEDFARVYGLTVGQYRRLAPYIHIGEEFRPAADVYGNTRHSYSRSGGGYHDTGGGYSYESQDGKPAAAHPRDTLLFPVKLRPGETVDLSIADTTMLKKVPGIGSWYARNIVRYREQLGGFHHVEQLLEIEGFPVDALGFFRLSQMPQRRLNVNKLTLAQLRKHPYINFYQAKEIVEYRRLKGPLHNISDLRLLPDFTPEAIQRLEPYLEY